MAAISLLNPKAEVARAAQALAVNISAAKGIQDVMKTNCKHMPTVIGIKFSFFSGLLRYNLH
jgi:T-complex protein 1 subunit zeta